MQSSLEENTPHSIRRSEWSIAAMHGPTTQSNKLEPPCAGPTGSTRPAISAHLPMMTAIPSAYRQTRRASPTGTLTRLHGLRKHRHQKPTTRFSHLPGWSARGFDDRPMHVGISADANPTPLNPPKKPFHFNCPPGGKCRYCNRQTRVPARSTHIMCAQSHKEFLFIPPTFR